jgi:hypothetical protein
MRACIFVATRDRFTGADSPRTTGCSVLCRGAAAEDERARQNARDITFAQMVETLAKCDSAPGRPAAGGQRAGATHASGQEKGEGRQ